MCQNRSGKAIWCLILQISRASLHIDFVELDKMQVNNQGVEHDLRRIEQIDSRLYNNEDTLGETKLDIELKWSFRVTHQFTTV